MTSINMTIDTPDIIIISTALIKIVTINNEKYILRNALINSRNCSVV